MATGEALEKELEARDPDVKLMLQVRDDVPGAFEILVGRYQQRLLGVLAHVIGSPTESEDLTQEVFLRVYRTRKGYRPKSKFSTWLFTIANNVALNYLRGRGRNPMTSLGGDSPSGPSPVQPSAGQIPGREGTPSSQMRQVELAEIVREALDSLSDDQRLAVVLNKFEEMSYAEIGEVMGRSEPAIKSLLARARMNLRDRLDAYLRTGDRDGRD